MIATQHARKGRIVIRYLARADRFNKLAKSCPPAYRRAFYRLKDKAIDRAICASPGEFEVDSISRGSEPVLGVTHVPSGRRFHVRPYRQAYATQVILHRLGQESGHEYAFLRHAGMEEGTACTFHAVAAGRAESRI